MKDVETIMINHWVMRFHRPQGSGLFPVLLMLHGWTGDENSMWIFAPRLPKDALLIAPRGIHETSGSGYSWHAKIPQRWPVMDDFSPAVDQLLSTITRTNFHEGDFSNLHLIGFSQGAALAYTLAIMHTERVASLAGLSGFLPERAADWLGNERLKGLPVFITHGTQDSLVPVERARTAVELIENAGAHVTYCEDDVGHKLSAKCFRGLEAFYRGINL